MDISVQYSRFSVARRLQHGLLCVAALCLFLLGAGCPGTPPQLSEIPDVRGMEQADAETQLEEAGFSMVLVVSQASSTPAGMVFNQMPAAGSWVSENTALTIYVSTGSAPPDIDAWSGLYGEGEFTEFSDILRTEDGGYVLSGETSEGDANRSLLLLKLDEDGEELWRKTYDVATTQRGEALAVTNDGGFIVVGYTDTATESGDVLLLKVNAEGERDWIREFGIEGLQYIRGFGVAQSLDGGYMLAATAMSDPDVGFGFGGRDVLLVKLNQLGLEEWSLWYGEDQDDEVHALRPTADNGFILAGSTSSFDAVSQDAFLLKTNVDGVLEWLRLFGGSGEDVARDVRQTPDGGYIMVGHTNSFDVPYRDMFVVRVDEQGNELWSRIIDINLLEDNEAGSDESAAGIQVTHDGHFLIAGGADAFGGDGSIAMVLLDSAGDLIWRNVVGGMGLDEALAVDLAQENGYVIAGFSESFGEGARQGYVVKTDEDGNALDSLLP